MDQTAFVIDDDDDVRDSLVFLLRSQGLTCRAFATAQAFLDQLRDDQQGCIITDVRMPEIDGLELVERLKARGCGMGVIVLTGHADVPIAVRAMKAGVYDFLEKPFPSDSLVEAVQAVMAQNKDEEGERARREAVARRAEGLTPRERQVYEAVVEGFSNKEIALELELSPRTIEIYRANVMTKMQAGSLSELVRMKLGGYA